MKASELVIGKRYMKTYPETGKPSKLVTYAGVIEDAPFLGQHDFDAVHKTLWFKGSICTDKDVEKVITEYKGEES